MGAQGTTTINFGTFPGDVTASVAVADTNILSGSLVEAWILPAATSDHSVDEHWIDPPLVYAGSVSAGVGFTIYGIVQQIWSGDAMRAETFPADTANRTYGAWTVAWCWN
jgi:hypothetical protein